MRPHCHPNYLLWCCHVSDPQSYVGTTHSSNSGWLMYKYSSTFPVNFDRNSNDEFNLRNLGTVLENNAFPGHNLHFQNFL